MVPLFVTQLDWSFRALCWEVAGKFAERGHQAGDEGAAFDHGEAVVECFADGGFVGELAADDGAADTDDGGGQDPTHDGGVGEPVTSSVSSNSGGAATSIPCWLTGGFESVIVQR